MLPQLLANGLVTGSIYALVALGFALIYNTTGIFHIAYASLYVFSSYALFYFHSQFGFPIALSFIFSIIATMFLSVFIEFLIYRPLKKNNSSSTVVLISSLGVMIVIINIISMVFGNESKIVNRSISGSLKLGGVILTYSQISQLVVTAIVLALFFIYLRFSRFGLSTRAMRDDEVLCTVFGMNISSMRWKLFALSGFFVALGGGLTAYDFGMDPYVGMPILLNAVVALIIGGVGRFEAPVLGGYLIASLQSLVIWQFSARWQEAVTFLLLIVFLLFRPEGILGEKKRNI
jgi:branched-chain amino acid transport system permease protein